ncbi:MAG: endolytic transglycosylase MltG [Candidatus Spechtbacterales bacterium]|nr:endolytic transglycosylase MltG [Candidatus Spechtbacterales bacterium]
MVKKIFKYVILTVIVLDLALLGFFAMFAYDISKARPTEGTIIIEQGTGLSDIAQILKREKIINNAFSFTLYAVIEGKADKLQAGIYEFRSDLSIRDIIRRIEEGTTKEFVRVTFPEGFRKGQIASRLQREGAIEDEDKFLELVNISTAEAAEIYDLPFLGELQASTLEGLLFPDTYEFHIGSEPQVVLEKFLINFSKKTEGLDIDYDDIIMASLIEREVQTEQDMRMVSGILNNRLSIGMALQVDATLAYITGKDTPQLSNADKEIDNPFNTYQYRGLPPAPIANPGLQAINAALNPTPNNYLYYLTAPDGTTHFARTLEEHNENKAKYLR